jgi:hypothetical protein
MAPEALSDRANRLRSAAKVRGAVATGRAADAQGALAPGLEGFSPTPEFPEIGEAHALLVAMLWHDADIPRCPI